MGVRCLKAIFRRFSLRIEIYKLVQARILFYCLPLRGFLCAESRKAGKKGKYTKKRKIGYTAMKQALWGDFLQFYNYTKTTNLGY